MSIVSPKELSAIEDSCRRAAAWPEPDRELMIEAAKDVIGRYYVDGRINAEIRDRLYKILSFPTA